MVQPSSHRKPVGGRAAADIDAAERSDARIARLSYAAGTLIGATQILALLAGISRSGVTMAGGLWRGLDHEDAARFAFLLATPVILAAGVLKVPSLLGPAGAHIQRAGRPRRHRLRNRCLPVRTVPRPLVPDPDPDPVRHLLPRLRRPEHHPVPLKLISQPACLPVGLFSIPARLTVRETDDWVTV
jgi:hypothetical protein